MREFDRDKYDDLYFVDHDLRNKWSTPAGIDNETILWPYFVLINWYNNNYNLSKYE